MKKKRINLEVGMKFRGLINGAEFEILEEKINEHNGKIYFIYKDLKTGKKYDNYKDYLERLLIEIID